MIILVNPNQYILCKDIFLKFTKQFQTKFPNNVEFLLHHKTLVEKDPFLTNYCYQFALAACFQNQKYDSREVMQIFDNTFKIKDTYLLNGNECDISTINSAFVANHMAKFTPFKSLPITLFNAPLEYKSEVYVRVQQQSPVRESVQKALLQTGQPNNDLTLGDVYYDFKHTSKTTMKLNHIYPWTYERILLEGENYLNNLFDILKQKKDPSFLNLSNQLAILKNNKHLSIHKKIEAWNTLLANQWVILEKKSINIPIIIQMTSKPFVPMMSKSLHEKIHLKSNVIEDEFAARVAIARIADMYGPSYLQNAYEMTSGLINSTLLENSNIEEVD